MRARMHVHVQSTSTPSTTTASSTGILRLTRLRCTCLPQHCSNVDTSHYGEILFKMADLMSAGFGAADTPKRCARSPYNAPVGPCAPIVLPVVLPPYPYVPITGMPKRCARWRGTTTRSSSCTTSSKPLRSAFGDLKNMVFSCAIQLHGVSMAPMLNALTYYSSPVYPFRPSMRLMCSSGCLQQPSRKWPVNIKLSHRSPFFSKWRKIWI